ncbi:MAG: pilus assembly protein TadG-related protein [Gaiellaceae bacterium]
MKLARLTCTRVADERGGVVLFVAIALPALLAAFTIALDVGNWFAHHRSLQNQVDAAALAGGALYADCFRVPPAQAEAAIKAEAVKYAANNPRYGASEGSTEGFNYNSNTYPSGVTTNDPIQNIDHPCSYPYDFEVKGSYQNIPLLFGGLLPGSTPLSHLDAHARVSLRQETIFSGLLPLGVPDPSSNYAFATFVDEATGNPIAGCAAGCTVQLQKSGASGGIQYWSSTAPLSVPVVANTGVRIRLVGGTNPAAACGSALAGCYAAGSSNGVVYIRGWNSAASAPAVHNAWLLPGTCTTDSYFAAAPCSSGLQAEVDLDSTHPLTGTLGQSATVTASAAGSNVQLTMSSGGCQPASATCNVWSVSSGLPLTATGPTNVSVSSWTWQQTFGSWQGKTCKSSGNNPCTASGTFASAVVQRGFVADPVGSGPIQSLQIGDAGPGTTAGADSFQAGTTHQLTVTLGAMGSLAVQSQASDPAVELRLAGSGTGSQNSIDCDPNISNLRGEIGAGCSPGYTINTGSPCPTANALWSSPSPWDCVVTQQGVSTGQVKQGFQDRILGGSNSCTAPIHWPNWGPGDPRIISLFLVPFNSLNGNGNSTVPVIGAASFYVTGWSGDPCPGATSVSNQGDVAGHFIKYVSPSNNNGGNTVCSPTALAPCVPVLSR